MTNSLGLFTYKLPSFCCPSSVSFVAQIARLGNALHFTDYSMKILSLGSSRHLPETLVDKTPLRVPDRP